MVKSWLKPVKSWLKTTIMVNQPILVGFSLVYLAWPNQHLKSNWLELFVPRRRLHRSCLRRRCFTNKHGGIMREMNLGCGSLYGLIWFIHFLLNIFNQLNQLAICQMIFVEYSWCFGKSVNLPFMMDTEWVISPFTNEFNGLVKGKQLGETIVFHSFSKVFPPNSTEVSSAHANIISDRPAPAACGRRTCQAGRAASESLHLQLIQHRKVSWVIRVPPVIIHL